MPPCPALTRARSGPKAIISPPQRGCLLVASAQYALDSDELEAPAWRSAAAGAVSEITDGTAHTLLISELAGAPITGSWACDSRTTPPCGFPTGGDLGIVQLVHLQDVERRWPDAGRQLHDQLQQFLGHLCLPSRRGQRPARGRLGPFLAVGLDRDVFAALITRAGGEFIDGKVLQ